MADGGLRVEACLPLQLRDVPPDQVAFRQRAVLTGPQVRDPATFNPRQDRSDVLSEIASKLEALEQKIDALVGLVLQERQRQARSSAVDLELHGEGLTFRWPVALAVGDVVELDLGLTLFPPRDIHLLARVVSCGQAGEDSHQIEAIFIAVNEDDRDEIHRFMLTAQRQQRRASMAAETR